MKAQENQTVRIRKSQLLAIAGVVFMASVFALAGYAMTAGSAAKENAYKPVLAGDSPQVQGGRQVVELTMKGGTYYPYPVQLKKGVPAVVNVDTGSVTGCYRAIQIPAFGVRKVVNDNDNRIEFTPDKAGTFDFSCFMGMGRGRITVEDETGSVPAGGVAAQAIQPAQSGACGAGCGCGGF